MTTLRNEVRQELENDILPFWMEKMTDSGRGGFYGRIDGGDTLHADAPKGADTQRAHPVDFLGGLPHIAQAGVS